MGDTDDIGFWSSKSAEGYFVCGKCVDDDEIKKFIDSEASSRTCNFCGRKSRTVEIAAPLDDVVEFMSLAIHREYERAIDALGWIGEEGGYQGSHWDSRDLLVDEIGLCLPNDHDGRLLDILVGCFGDEPWCERNPYGERPDERLVSSWERFCEYITHQRRYFFLHRQADESHSVLREHLPAAKLLEFIGETVSQHELVRTAPAGSLIYRARQQRPGETFQSPYDFGPPPVECAVRSNRMSPAGIVMFYGSDDPDTAIAEIDDDPRMGIAVATFRLTREARILDLTKLPRRLAFFEQQPDSSSYDRYAIEFLHRFTRSLAAKVERGNREHIDYVPTQVVTEWFRTAFSKRHSALDGIRYTSAQRVSGKSIVLFADKYDVVLNPKQIREIAGTQPLDEWSLRNRHEEAWLKLVRKRVVRVAQLASSK